MKKTVVTFADDAGNYKKGVERMKESIRQHSPMTGIVSYHDYEHIGSPPHKGEGSVPYAFKAYAMRKAMREVGGVLLWLDSCIYATQPLAPVFDHIKRHGYIFFNNIGYSIGDYTSDACLEKQGMSREKSFNAPMIMACAYGIDVANKIGLEFMLRYIHAAVDGVSYQGDWFNDKGQVSSNPNCKGHRHDQSVASIIIQQMGLDVTNAQKTWFAYESHKETLPIADSVCLWSGGL